MKVKSPWPLSWAVCFAVLSQATDYVWLHIALCFAAGLCFGLGTTPPRWFVWCFKRLWRQP